MQRATPSKDAWDAARKANPLGDESRLDVRGDTIHYKLYGQDGSFVEMTTRNTVSMRRFCAWVRISDRYSVGGE
jgi:hypothetical protein